MSDRPPGCTLRRRGQRRERVLPGRWEGEVGARAGGYRPARQMHRSSRLDGVALPDDDETAFSDGVPFTVDGWIDPDLHTVGDFDVLVDDRPPYDGASADVDPLQEDRVLDARVRVDAHIGGNDPVS